MISGGELTAAARVAGAIRRVLKRPDPVAILRRRQEVRDEIRTNLTWPEKDSSPEILVIRVGKDDEYPKPDNRLLQLGASPWHKFEVKGLHDRGLEVFLPITRVRFRKGVAREVEHTDEGGHQVFPVGRIPYERIDVMDWQPDPAYGAPRFYVAYGRRGPIKETVLYERRYDDNYLFEIHDVKYRPRKVGVIARARLNWASRRHQRKALPPRDDRTSH